MPDLFTPLDGRPWPQERMARQAPTWAPSGVIGSPVSGYGSGPAGLSFAVAGSVITVALALFRANARGFLYERTGTPWQSGQPASGSAADGTQSLATAAYPLQSGSNPRIDRMVLRRDLAAGTIYPFIIRGTPAAVPVRPDLVREETGVWDTPLFSWQLAGGNSTSITNIVDERVWVDPGGDGRAGVPYVECYLRRSDGSNVLNPDNWTDLKTYLIPGQQVGAEWDLNYAGSGLAHPLPGRYGMETSAVTLANAGRYEAVSTRGDSSELRQIGIPAYSAAGYGAAGGYSEMRCPNGLKLLLRAYTSSVIYGGSNTQPVNLRTEDGTAGGTPLSRVRVTYLGPL